jgi:hypothetical protein
MAKTNPNKVISGLKSKKMDIRVPTFYRYNNKGWIYAIKVGDYLKIGSTSSPERRFERYTSVPPFEIEVLILEEVEDKTFYERAFQSMFMDYQVKGEWFYIGDVERYTEYVIDNYEHVKKEISKLI